MIDPPIDDCDRLPHEPLTFDGIALVDRLQALQDSDYSESGTWMNDLVLCAVAGSPRREVR